MLRWCRQWEEENYPKKRATKKKKESWCKAKQMQQPSRLSLLKHKLRTRRAFLDMDYVLVALPLLQLFCLNIWLLHRRESILCRLTRSSKDEADRQGHVHGIGNQREGTLPSKPSEDEIYVGWHFWPSSCLPHSVSTFLPRALLPKG